MIRRATKFVKDIFLGLPIALIFVNLLLIGIIGIRFVNDIQNWKNVGYYLSAFGISLMIVLLGSGMGLPSISNGLKRCGVVSAVQFMLLIFVLAQLFIYRQKIKKILVRQIHMPH